MWMFIASALAGWQAQNAAGDCPGVIAALPAPSSDLERLAVARCQAAMGAGGQALEVLQVERADLQRYAAIVRAEALLARDRPAEAVTVLAPLTLTDDGEKLLRARALIASKRSLEARDTLRGLLETRYGPEARFLLAVGAADRGEKDAAIATFRAVWVRHPTSAWSDRAVARLAQLGVTVPELETPEGRALAWDRVEVLLDAQQAELAVPLMESIASRAPLTEDQRWTLARAYGSARQHPKAAALYAELDAPHASAARAFAQAISTARGGDYAAAGTLYEALIARYPSSPEAEEATYKLGYMRYDSHDYSWAIPRFDDYLKKYPEGKFAADARWFTAWGLHKLGRDDDAMAAMDVVIRKHGSTDLALASRYWKARLSNNTAQLESLITSNQDSGYAWFASQRTGKTWKVAAVSGTPSFSEAFLATRPSLRTGLDLLRAGFVEWGRPLVLAQVEAAKSAGKTETIAMAWALVDAESYQEAQRLVGPWCSESAPEIRQVCVPRPYREVVEAEAKAHGLPIYLPYAIMNAESGLNPSVTSPAGARGLMQLMPKLAAGLATDMPSFTIDDLYRAGVNARLGTRELGQLFERFGGSNIRPSLPLVIAGYNGGGDAVQRWVDGYKVPPEADEFAEDISYTETRRYVRRVLGFLQRYRRTYGD